MRDCYEEDFIQEKSKCENGKSIISMIKKSTICKILLSQLSKTVDCQNCFDGFIQVKNDKGFLSCEKCPIGT